MGQIRASLRHFVSYVGRGLKKRRAVLRPAGLFPVTLHGDFDQYSLWHALFIN
jgi:hypothetical protein